MSPFLFQDFQKEIVRAAEAFTAIGYKHIETGDKLRILSALLYMYHMGGLGSDMQLGLLDIFYR